MPKQDANAERQTRRRLPRDHSQRTDRFAGFMVQPRLPKEFENRGRGTVIAAFKRFQKRRNLTGPPSSLESIPEGNVRLYETAIAINGATPVNAGALMFGVERTTIYRWLEDGKDPDCKDPMKREFYMRTERAVACKNACAEGAVFVGDPLKYLLHSPDSQPAPEVPGWSTRQTMLHANHLGDGPPTYELRLEIKKGGGYETHEQPAIPAEVVEP